MKKYNVIVESIHTDFVEVNAASFEEAKDIALTEMSKIYEYVEYDSEDVYWVYGEYYYNYVIDGEEKYVVSTMYDYVEVDANDEEEAKKIAKRTVSDIYESVDYSSDRMKFLYGDSKFKAQVEEQ